MKKLSYFFVAIFASSIILFACDGQQGRDDQGRTPGNHDGMHQQDDRGMHRDDQDRQMQDNQNMRQPELNEQDTVGVGTDIQQPSTQPNPGTN